MSVKNIFRKINDIVSSFWVLSSFCEGMEVVTLLTHREPHWLTPAKLSFEPLNFPEDCVFSGDWHLLRASCLSGLWCDWVHSVLWQLCQQVLSPCCREDGDNKQLRCWRHRALPCVSQPFTCASWNSRSPPSHHAQLAPGTMDSCLPTWRHTPCWRVRSPSRHRREKGQRREDLRVGISPPGYSNFPAVVTGRLGRICESSWRCRWGHGKHLTLWLEDASGFLPHL